ncbi:MAG: glycosyltransferase family 1 protein, partial [Sphingobacteriaceae bacterium]
MPIICNARVTNASLTGAQRYTLSILNHIPGIERISPSKKYSSGIKGHLWEQFVMPRLIGNKLLWSPSNSGPVTRSRQVLTVHDVVSIDHPEWFNKTYVKWYNVMLPLVCKKAAHIITISEFTKHRLIDLFNIPESKISLVYNGGGERLAGDTASQKTYELPFKRYILSVGSLEIRKNIPFLLESWNGILSQLPEDVGLIIVGGKGNAKIFQDANIHQIPDRVHFTGHIPDDFVTYLYTNALAFV